MEPALGSAEEPKLRHVEKDVLIPKLMREKARELCSDKVQEIHMYQTQKRRFLLCEKGEPIIHHMVVAICKHYIKNYLTFTKCCQDTGVLMVVKCQEENTALKECLTHYYNDPAFYEECKVDYVKQREEYRATGIRPAQKQQKLPTSM